MTAHVITISPPLTMDEMKDGPALGVVELIHLRAGDFDHAAPWTANTIDLASSRLRYDPDFIRDEIQEVVDYYVGHEFTGFIEARNLSPDWAPASRFVMRDRIVVRLDPILGWPPEQADDSEGGLMEILADPDSIVSVTQQCAGYATDVWETVPADDTSLPERLLVWRDLAVQRALSATSGDSGEATQWAIWSYVYGGWRIGNGYTIDVARADRFTARQARTMVDEEARDGLADGKPRSLMMLGPEVRTVDDDVTVMNSRLKWAFQNEMRKYGPDGQRTDLAEAVS